MTQAAFDTTAPKDPRGQKADTAWATASRPAANKKSFYQCMSSSNNHVTGCDRQFATEPEGPRKPPPNQPAFAGLFACRSSLGQPFRRWPQRSPWRTAAPGAFQVRHQAVEPLRLGLVGKSGPWCSRPK